MKIHSFGIKSLPKILFAHEYSTENYEMSFPVQPNMVEISYLTEGSIFLKREKREELIPEGAVVVHLRREPETAYTSRKHSHITVGFAVTLTEEEEVRLPNYFTPENGEKYRSKIRKIIEEFTVTRKTTVQLSAMILSLVTDIAAEYGRAEDALSPNYGERRYTEKAKRYVAAHLSEKIRVADIAHAVGLSVGYLSNLFRRVTGKTLVEYVNETKLQRVKELTVTRGLTVKEAGRIAGFEDENYVSRIYRRYFGETLSGR